MRRPSIRDVPHRVPRYVPDHVPHPAASVDVHVTIQGAKVSALGPSVEIIQRTAERAPTLLIVERSWRVKLRQAEHHVERFAKVAADYLESSRAGFDYNIDDEAGTIDVVLRADLDPPVVLGAIIGDVLHNLRSALDSIAWEACQRTGVPLTAQKEQQVYFPITWETKGWTKAAKRLVGVTPEHLKAFEYLQPWYFDEQGRQLGVDIPAEYAKNEPLWQLNELAKIDRHRTLHPLLTQAGDTWLGTPEGVETGLAGVDPPPWTPGNTILRWSVRPAHRVREASPAGDAVLSLTKADDLRPPSALRTLQDLVAATDRALRHIEIEVLQVVTTTELAELTALGERWQDAQRAVQHARRESGVFDRERFERQKALMEYEKLAKEAYTARWHDLFR